MASAFSAALLSYEASLEEVTETLKFFEKAAILKPKSAALLGVVQIDSYTKGLVQDFYQAPAFNQFTLHRALVAIAYGSYETFIKTLIADAAEKISSSKAQFTELDSTFVKHHQRQSGLMLASVFEPRDHYKFNYFEVSRNIGSCFPGNAAWKINKEAFSLFESPLNAKGIDHLLNRIGIQTKTNWEEMAETKHLEKYEGIASVKKRAARIKETLDQFVKLRNDVAHNGVTGLSVTYQEISDYLNFISLFGNGIADFLEDSIH